MPTAIPTPNLTVVIDQSGRTIGTGASAEDGITTTTTATTTGTLIGSKSGDQSPEDIVIVEQQQQQMLQQQITVVSPYHISTSPSPLRRHSFTEADLIAEWEREKEMEMERGYGYQHHYQNHNDGYYDGNGNGNEDDNDIDIDSPGAWDDFSTSEYGRGGGGSYFDDDREPQQSQQQQQHMQVRRPRSESMENGDRYDYEENGYGYEDNDDGNNDEEGYGNGDGSALTAVLAEPPRRRARPPLDPIQLAFITTYKLNQERVTPSFDLKRLVLMQNMLGSIYGSWSDLMPQAPVDDAQSDPNEQVASPESENQDANDAAEEGEEAGRDGSNNKDDRLSRKSRRQHQQQGGAARSRSVDPALGSRRKKRSGKRTSPSQEEDDSGSEPSDEEELDSGYASADDALQSAKKRLFAGKAVAREDEEDDDVPLGQLKVPAANSPANTAITASASTSSPSKRSQSNPIPKALPQQPPASLRSKSTPVATPSGSSSSSSSSSTSLPIKPLLSGISAPSSIAPAAERSTDAPSTSTSNSQSSLSTAKSLSSNGNTVIIAPKEKPKSISKRLSLSNITGKIKRIVSGSGLKKNGDSTSSTVEVKKPRKPSRESEDAYEPPKTTARSRKSHSATEAEAMIWRRQVQEMLVPTATVDRGVVNGNGNAGGEQKSEKDKDKDRQKDRQQREREKEKVAASLAASVAPAFVAANTKKKVTMVDKEIQTDPVDDDDFAWDDEVGEDDVLSAATSLESRESRGSSLSGDETIVGVAVATGNGASAGGAGGNGLSISTNLKEIEKEKAESAVAANAKATLLRRKSSGRRGDRLESPLFSETEMAEFASLLALSSETVPLPLALAEEETRRRDEIKRALRGGIVSLPPKPRPLPVPVEQQIQQQGPDDDGFLSQSGYEGTGDGSERSPSIRSSRRGVDIDAPERSSSLNLYAGMDINIAAAATAAAMSARPYGSHQFTRSFDERPSIPKRSSSRTWTSERGISSGGGSGASSNGGSPTSPTSPVSPLSTTGSVAPSMRSSSIMRVQGSERQHMMMMPPPGGKPISVVAIKSGAEPATTPGYRPTYKSQQSVRSRSGSASSNGSGSSVHNDSLEDEILSAVFGGGNVGGKGYKKRKRYQQQQQQLQQNDDVGVTLDDVFGLGWTLEGSMGPGNGRNKPFYSLLSNHTPNIKRSPPSSNLQLGDRVQKKPTMNTNNNGSGTPPTARRPASMQPLPRSGSVPSLFERKPLQQHGRDAAASISRTTSPIPPPPPPSQSSTQQPQQSLQQLNTINSNPSHVRSASSSVLNGNGSGSTNGGNAGQSFSNPSSPPPPPLTNTGGAGGGASGSVVNGNGSVTPPAYSCPICAEDCLNLLQLNQHLDDAHTEVEDAGTMILQWLRKTGRSATKAMQTTTQKAAQSFDKLDKIVTGAVGGGAGGGFELNNNGGGTADGSSSNLFFGASGSQGASGSGSGGGGGEGGFLNADSSGGEESVTRRHWERETGHDVCKAVGCGKSLGGPGIRVGTLVVGVGKSNCRRCGKLFCDAHTMFQMRLAPGDASHDPANGVWCRVCQSCYESREGYRDLHGVSRVRTATFLKLRKTKADQIQLHTNMLEKRLEKLSKLYATEGTVVNRRSSISSLAALTTSRNLDQQVVAWEDDWSTSACRICKYVLFEVLIDGPFSTIFMNRRHHCRLCGRIVCGKETCSDEPPDPVGEIRVCTDCKVSIHRRRNAVEELANKPDAIKLYEAMARVKTKVDDTLPRFNSLIMSLSNAREVKATDHDYLSAVKYRKALMDYFAEIDSIGKRIKALPAKSQSFRKLQDNIHHATIQYLQSNMFTLNMMPNVTNPNGKPPSSPTTEGKIRKMTLDELERLDAASKALEAMEAQENQLRTFIDEAIGKRRLEDAAVLKEALRDVVVEVDRLRGEVRNMKMKMEA
ncbi:carboxypeptidase Y-deficient [Blyttiomyces sp. JEL0837]|nr:carboxypeptidase Y-deficient [Blyttiomyces sp. JEL0837]